MERPIPKDYGKLSYIVTIQGAEGNLKGLADCVDASNLVSDDLISPPMTNARAYWAVKNPNNVEFDVYTPKRVVEGQRPVTQTSSFRRGLGELTTMMLQNGYNLSVKKVDLPIQPEGRLKF